MQTQLSYVSRCLPEPGLNHGESQTSTAYNPFLALCVPCSVESAGDEPLFRVSFKAPHANGLFDTFMLRMNMERADLVLIVTTPQQEADRPWYQEMERKG
jgi:hypothetical protein